MIEGKDCVLPSFYQQSLNYLSREQLQRNIYCLNGAKYLKTKNPALCGSVIMKQLCNNSSTSGPRLSLFKKDISH